MTPTVEDISARLAAGAPLTEADAQAIVSTPDLVTVGMLADEVRRAQHGDRVTFVRVANVSVSPPAAGSDEIPAGAGEIRIVGVFDRLDAAVARVAAITARANGTPVSGFSLADLEEFCRLGGPSLLDVLEALRDRGLELVAEAPIDRLRDPDRSLEAVARAGLQVARLTVHDGGGGERLALLRRVRACRAAFGRLTVFAPLPRALGAPSSTGYEDLKQVALARLVVDNIPSIQVDWALYGPKLAQVALTFGADDVDAVSPFDSSNEGPRRAPLEEIRRNIRAASLVPIERNGRFETVRR